MDPEASTPSPAPDKKRTGCLVRSLWIAGGVLIALLLTVWLARRQIGDKLARALDDRMAAAGVYMTWDSAAWVPGPGIKLSGLALYRDAAKKDRIAHLSSVTAIKGESGWSEWSVLKVKMDEASLTLASGDLETKLTHLDTDAVIRPGAAEIHQLDAILQGLRIEVKGDYIRSKKSDKEETAEAEAADTAGKSLFADLDLSWLKSLKEWAHFKPHDESPVVRLQFECDPSGEKVSASVSASGGNFDWRGVTWSSLNAEISGAFGGTSDPLKISRIELGHQGKSIQMAGVYDLEKGELDLENVKSDLDWLALFRAFAPDAAQSLSGLSTDGTWRLAGKGKVPVSKPLDTRFTGTLALEGKTTYKQDAMTLIIDGLNVSVEMAEGKATLSELKAGTWGGELSAPQTVIDLGGPFHFETKAVLRNARLADIVSSFGTPDNRPGLLDCTWSGSGGAGLKTLSGGGDLSIRDAEFYRVPLLGPLHLVFDKLTPGFGKDVASSLTADHQLSDGILQISNLKLSSSLTEIAAQGTINLESNYAHLTAQAKLKGIVGLTTALVSQLLAVEGEGPITDVKWGLKNLNGTEILTDTMKLTGKAGSAVIDVTGGAAKTATGAAKGTVEGAGKAAKEIIKIPGKLNPFKKN